MAFGIVVINQGRNMTSHHTRIFAGHTVFGNVFLSLTFVCKFRHIYVKS